MPQAFKLKYLLITSLLIPCLSVAANSESEQCHQPIPGIAKDNVPTDKLMIKSDQLRIENQQIYSLEGHVEFITGQQVLNTDSARFDYLTKDLQAAGNIFYQQPGLFIRGESLQLDIDDASGSAKQTQYALSPTNANGYAENIEFKQERLQLNNADYTTCPPDKKAWQISAEEIILDHQKNEGIARNAKIKIFSVPIFYVPYISFPLMGRKTGFLAPEPAFSTTDGFDLRLPYYLNLAPNYDLTLTPRYIEKRGGQLGAEFRYLQHNYAGEAGAEYLPSDQKTQSDRYQILFSQHNYLDSNTWLTLNATHVSDMDYYSNLGTSLNTANQSQLNRHVLYQTHGRHWYFSSLFNDYQMLNQQIEPYRRLPQLDFLLSRNFNGLSTNLLSQYSYFYRSRDDKLQRLILMPSMSFPLQKNFGYFIPSTGVYARVYETEHKQRHDQHWYFHATGALYFDRDTNTGTHTLEPRFSYVYFPHKSQAEFPLIDSDALILSYDELFNNRRYNGWDRFGDIHRITGGIENHWIDLNGQPRFSLKFALAKMLKQQHSNFAGDTALDQGETIYAASTETQISERVKFSGDILSIESPDKIDYLSFSARYAQNSDNQMELRYDFRSNLLEQTTLIYTRKIANQWRIATRWSYSNNHQQIREGLAGLEYNNCCWSVRVVGRRYANIIGEEAKNAIALQFELKGLTAIGSRLEDTFSQEIFGIQ